MLGFFCPFKDIKGKVTKDKVYFVSVPDNSKEDEIRMLTSKKARSFAEKLDLNEVYLHFGKEKIIKYDFTV